MFTKSSLKDRQKLLFALQETFVQINKKEENLRRFSQQVDNLESCEKLSIDDQLGVRVLKKRREIRQLSQQHRKIRKYDSDSDF